LPARGKNQKNVKSQRATRKTKERNRGLFYFLSLHSFILLVKLKDLLSFPRALQKRVRRQCYRKETSAGNPKIRPSFLLLPFHMRPGPISLTMSLTFARSTKVEIIKKKRLGLTVEITRLSFNKDIFDEKIKDLL
jgi:hypothetical protein